MQEKEVNINAGEKKVLINLSTAEEPRVDLNMKEVD